VFEYCHSFGYGGENGFGDETKLIYELLAGPSFSGAGGLGLVAVLYHSYGLRIMSL